MAKDGSPKKEKKEKKEKAPKEEAAADAGPENEKQRHLAVIAKPLADDKLSKKASSRGRPNRRQS
jgi:hypothetical protein